MGTVPRPPNNTGFRDHPRERSGAATGRLLEDDRATNHQTPLLRRSRPLASAPLCFVATPKVRTAPMASEKSEKPKRKGAAGKTAAAQTYLRQLTDPRFERRYEPGTSPFAIATVVIFSIGAVALGAGVYAQWLRSGGPGPHPWSMYFLIAGAVLLLSVALFGQTNTRPVRVGDGGVAVERDETTVERIAWCDVDRLLVSSTMVTVQGAGVTIAVPLQTHAAAAARVVREARERIPKVAEGVPDVAAVNGVEPNREELDPPQIAGRACKATGKVVSFEKDARLCGRCGELYHKAGAPNVCLTCGAPLK